mmetsp:Transcript_33565/g.92949  ORF Transcript_33565/g.92949 Transcript_33565/m.92949 type:complete len:225 (-) Transcript_33565:1019-1693(-)
MPAGPRPPAIFGRPGPGATAQRRGPSGTSMWQRWPAWPRQLVGLSSSPAPGAAPRPGGEQPGCRPGPPGATRPLGLCGPAARPPRRAVAAMTLQGPASEVAGSQHMRRRRAQTCGSSLVRTSLAVVVAVAARPMLPGERWACRGRRRGRRHRGAPSRSGLPPAPTPATRPGRTALLGTSLPQSSTSFPAMATRASATAAAKRVVTWAAASTPRSLPRLPLALRH